MKVKFINKEMIHKYKTNRIIQQPIQSLNKIVLNNSLLQIQNNDCHSIDNKDKTFNIYRKNYENKIEEYRIV